MRDADEEIREIKREIIESRGLVIKTNNLTNALAADIKSIAKRQAGYERRFNWNSAVAYVLFATLSFVGLKLWSDVRLREIEGETKALERELGELRRDLAEETARAEARERAEAKAAQFYDLVRLQKRAEAVERFEAIRHEQLSRAEAAFFADIVERFRRDLSVQAYQNGLDLARTGRYAEAADQFQEAIRLEGEASHIPAVKYHLARTLARLGRTGEAMVLAQAVIDQNVDRELQDDAAWLLAECAMSLGNLDDARNALRMIMRRWPRSQIATDARRQLADLNQRILRGQTPPARPGAASSASPSLPRAETSPPQQGALQRP
jgi:TolA-binding protein